MEELGTAAKAAQQAVDTLTQTIQGALIVLLAIALFLAIIYFLRREDRIRREHDEELRLERKEKDALRDAWRAENKDDFVTLTDALATVKQAHDLVIKTNARRGS